ncbi:MAG: LysR family transcriptional regulator, partial [Bacilli bacterium]
MLHLSLLRTFLVVAKTENITHTAEILFLTQPAVSKHIQRLEKELATTLFIRNGKRLTLSVGGELFLPYAQQILNTYDTSIALFHREKKQYDATLRIVAAPQIAISVLPNIIKPFLDEHPNVEVKIMTAPTDNIEHYIVDNRAHVGFTKVPSKTPDLFCTHITSEPIVLVANRLSANTEERLFLNKMLLIDNQTEIWPDIMYQAYAHYPDVPTLSVESVEVTKQLIRNDTGFSYLPLSSVDLNTMNIIQQQHILTPKTSIYHLVKENNSLTNTMLTLTKSYF